MSALAFLLLSFPGQAGTPRPPSCEPRLEAAQDPADLKAQYAKRRLAAEGDVDQLFELGRWCDEQGLKTEAKNCFLAVIKLDEEHVPAREALGHSKYDGKWFTTAKKLEEYKAQKEEREAKEKGLVRYKDGWVDPADVPQLEKGLVKDANGKWLTPEEKQRIDEGWRRQDLLWIAPAEFAQLDQGLWKCADQWLAEPEADRYHSQLGRWWEIPSRSGHILLRTTLPRKQAEQALGVVEFALRDLARAYGVAAPKTLEVVILNSLTQYQKFAGGDRDTRTNPAVATGFDSVHGACMAEMYLSNDLKTYLGCGVSYWDTSSTSSSLFGAQFARHALGQSYAEALDPSPKTVAKFLRDPGKGLDAAGFYAEKKIPQWFRLGAACYVERYLNANLPGEAPDALRKWSIQNIVNKGGLDPLDTILAAQIDPADAATGGKRINEAGLLLAFVLDGKCAPVVAAHAAVKEALSKGQDPSKAIADLGQEIKRSEADLRKFAGL